METFFLIPQYQCPAWKCPSWKYQPLLEHSSNPSGKELGLFLSWYEIKQTGLNPEISVLLNGSITGARKLRVSLYGLSSTLSYFLNKVLWNLVPLLKFPFAKRDSEPWTWTKVTWQRTISPCRLRGVWSTWLLLLYEAGRSWKFGIWGVGGTYRLPHLTSGHSIYCGHHFPSGGSLCGLWLEEGGKWGESPSTKLLQFLISLYSIYMHSLSWWTKT